MSAQRPAGRSLLVVIDPAARAMDGESVRIAKDVLCAGSSSVKIACPESAEEADRVLTHRGRRHPVIVGDDGALLRTVRMLHRERALRQAPVGFVPVGPKSALLLARALGVPAGPVPAARAVLDGAERELDLLVDDSGGIVVGALRIPCGTSAAPHWWSPVERGVRSLARTLAAPIPALPPLSALPSLASLRRTSGASALPGIPGLNGHRPKQRLRVEADGVILADLDRPVREVAVRTTLGGLAEVFVRRAGDDGGPTPVQARAVTVSGRDFHYRADAAVGGPVRTRTWTVHPAAWRLTVPR